MHLKKKQTWKHDRTGQNSPTAWFTEKVSEWKDGLSPSESQFKTTEIPFLDRHFILTIKLSEIQKFDHTLSMAVNYQTLCNIPDDNAKLDSSCRGLWPYLTGLYMQIHFQETTWKSLKEKLWSRSILTQRRVLGLVALSQVPVATSSHGGANTLFFSPPGVSCSNCVDGVFTVGLEEAFSSFAILSPNGHFYKMFHFLNNFYFIEV